MKSFTKKVIETVKNIPKGQVLSYSEVARLAGSPRASRAVGSIMKKNKDLSVPCHRVIKSNGSFGRYSGLRGNSKSSVLRSEGYLN